MSKDEKNIVLGVLALTALVLLLYSIILAIPIAVVGFTGYMIYYWRHSSASALERKARQHTQQLYRDALGRHKPLEPDEFALEVFNRLPHVPEALIRTMAQAAYQLYVNEGIVGIAEPPVVCHSIEGARYRDYLSHVTAHDPERAIGVVVEAYRDFLPYVPTLIDEDTIFSVPIADSMELPAAINDTIRPFFDDPSVFQNLTHQIDRNIHEVSGVPFPSRRSQKLVLPLEYTGENIAYAYLKDTPLLDLFDARVPFAIPTNTRFEHQWVVAPPGSGKTTLLQAMLAQDFDAVARDEASVIVMDSNRDLIKSIERLKRFAPGGDLDGKLILIDTEDVEWPLALSLFGSATEHLETFSPRDREALYNSAVSMLDYIFGALLGAQMTSRQQTLFNFAIQLLFQIPEATLDTLVVLMQEGGLEPFEEHVKKLNPDARQFFELKFNGKEFRDTKSQVVDRLFAIKRIQAISRMFSAPTSKIDFYTEMGSAKVILINIPRSLLQEDGVEVLGRFFLAMILLAAEKRQLLPRGQRLDTFCYVDECQDVIRNDTKIPTVLDQCRKLRVSACLAHQRLSQLSPPVLNALAGSTAIKFAAKMSGSEASSMARNMNATPDFIMGQPKFSFAAHVAGTTDKAISLSVPFTDFSTMEQMSDEEFDALRDEMRAKYATYRSELGGRAEPDDAEPETDDPDPEDWG